MSPIPFRRKVRSDVTDGSAAVAAEPELAAARLFVASEVVDGWVPTSERVSDILNRERWLRAQVVSEAGGAEWRSFDREDLLLVVPPAHASPRDRRIHKLRRRTVLRVGRYAVAGIVQLPVGSDLGSFLLRTSPHFLPLTDASISWRVGAAEEFEEAAVVLVNTATLAESSDEPRSQG